MTVIYCSNTAEFQSTSAHGLFRVAGWITKALVLHRARRSKMQTIRYLRSLDRATLEDIGVDVDALGGPQPVLSRATPYVIAMASFSGNRYFQI